MASEKEKRPVREDASLLSVTVILVGLLCLTAAAQAGGESTLAVLFFAVFAIGVLGRVWAFLTVRNLRIRLSASKTRMFPGDETRLSWQITNEKLLPVLWVDVEMPLAKQAVFRPAEEDGETYRQRFSLIGSTQTAVFDTSWHAVRRGLYSMEESRFYTGDGLGITRYRLEAEAGSQKNFIIYPRIVPVRTEMFLKHMWEGDAGTRGVMEDPSVIRLTRPYESNDSLKRINWRMLARGQEMTVNQYEVISPRAIHFIFDGESWQRMENGRRRLHRHSLEESLEILASLLLGLKAKGMECGFSFPETDRLPAVNLFAGDGFGAENESSITGEILFRMAEYEPKTPVLARPEEDVQDRLCTFPSVLQEEAILHGSQNVGKYYFVTYNEESAAASALLPRMDRRSVEVLTAQQLHELKEGGTV